MGEANEKKPLSDLERMKEIVPRLNEAAKAYYQENREIMSNLEYDALYDELSALEEKTGITLNESPTIHVGYEVRSELARETHASPMLSLDKTKSPEDFAAWLGDREGLLSWKMDGLTVVLTYRDGTLFKAVTRGNGLVGEIVTANARTFKNIPLRIPFAGELVLRGEAVIRYSDFKKLNETIEDVDARYKNPRNLCSGSVRQLDSSVTAARNVYFFAFTLVGASGKELSNSVEENMRWLSELGFEIVPYERVNGETILPAIRRFAERIGENDFPSDGLVLIYDDIAYGRSLGRTAKFPRNSIAFKWADEQAVTTLTQIEWSPSRTGLINPVAVFEPVALEGTTVSRASLHNVSIMEGLKLGIGDSIKVYKANMIIPQISENLTQSGTCAIPDHCPACGGPTLVKEENGVRTLYCENPFCSAKKVKLFAHYVSRDAMNIDGISEATLRKMIDKEFLSELPDLYILNRYKEEILAMEGFGARSYERMMEAIETSRTTEPARFLYALGIPNVGSVNAKLLCGYFGNEFDRVRTASVDEMTAIEGVGVVIARSVRDYFDNAHNKEIVDALTGLLTFVLPKQEENPDGAGADISGKTFVITGAVAHFKNRAEVRVLIESLGGKVTGSVSRKTDYLINNDAASTSAKNQKARELGIPILTEEAFMNMAGIEPKDIG